MATVSGIHVRKCANGFVVNLDYSSDEEDWDSYPFSGNEFIATDMSKVLEIIKKNG